MGNISSGETTRVGGTDIHLPAVRGVQDDIFNVLFGPLADEIGKGLAANYRQSQGEELSPAETDNLKRHAEAVHERQNTPKKEPTRKQRKNLFEWIDEASETDPDASPEDAAKWQAVLSEILGRNDQTSLDALKVLNTYDVKAISNLESSGGRLAEGEAARLISFGVVERRSPIRNPIFVPFVAIGVVALFPVINTNLFEIFNSGFNDLTNFDVAQSRYQMQIASAGMVSFMSFSAAVLYWTMQASRVYFTSLGRDIKKNIDRFMRL